MKKIFLLINGKVTGPYQQDILTKFELEKDLKIKFEDENKWMHLEEFLKLKNEIKAIDAKEAENKNSDLKLIRVKEKKIKHIRNPFGYKISKIFRKHEKLGTYLIIFGISLAILILFFYFKYKMSGYTKNVF